jgi:putative Mg2+ transporter-C (MgtC) family protein
VGIGFLGAGSIIFHDDKVVGLTTAAGLWAAAALGMLVGVGKYFESAILTIIILIILLTVQFQDGKGWFKTK